MTKLITGLLAGVLILSSSCAFADTVYATKNGKKYHHADCKFLQKGSPVSISLEEAQQKGLKPCGKCFKESALEKPSNNRNLTGKK